MHIHLSLFVSCNLLCIFSGFSYGLDSITSSQSLSDDGMILESKGGSFALGFFSPGLSKNRYLGVWYKKIPVQTVVWVANRLNPINDSSGLLMINKTGNPVLTSQSKRVIWSANLSKQVQTPVKLQLLDSGNLVLRGETNGGDTANYFWQSFDYPSDTLLPGMKLGWDLRTGLERRITSWTSPDDPSPGDFNWGIELQDIPEAVIWKGSRKFFRSGPWNGLRFSGAPELKHNPFFVMSFVSNVDELYYTFNLTNQSIISRIVMNQTVNQRLRYTWSDATQNWIVYATVPRDQCDNYGLCGVYGNCVITESPICQCLEGFKPKSAEDVDWSQGCVHNKPLNYSIKDSFIKYDGLKLPDAAHSWVNNRMNLEECRETCLENSSCMAYANSDLRGVGSGCFMWFTDLIDIRQFPSGGQDLYIRMSASELGNKNKKKKKILIIATAISLVAGVLVLIVGLYIHKMRRNLVEKTDNTISDQKNEDRKENLELPFFELDVVSNATDNFSIDNKLGEGGFGSVYKGTMADGQEIAVKRLLKISGQGLNELKNEVRLIAKLQHRNLVKLLGCCIQEEEKLLIYEFMPNRSLNYFIFDSERSKPLDWSKRFNIICAIARGLLYLHQDSRLRIIHRDLKASNVLLDHEMNPKISDFGLAKSFGGDQSEGNTKRVVGTYGYMAPEYATDGLYSVKSDVFSFGVLLLEIVSGKKSTGYYHPDCSLNLIGHAWKLWKEEKPLELIDSCLGASSSSNLSEEVIMCIHISLLCVQQFPEDRPSMSSVIMMLGGESKLAEPKQPGFLMDRKAYEIDSSLAKPESSSTNDMTISLLDAR